MKTFLHWFTQRTQVEETAANAEHDRRWIEQEERRQLIEVKERLERVEDELQRIRKRQGDG